VNVIKSLVISSFVCIVLFGVQPSLVIADTEYSTGSAAVSAEVISQTFNPPVITAPLNNSVTSNPREPMVWQRPNPIPVTPLHHYDVYLDGNIIAYSISDSITSQTYYSYSVYRQNNTFSFYLSSNLSDGYHTWQVVAYNTYGSYASSDTITFYVDATAPFIKLSKVDNQTLNWDTSIPSSIPGNNQRNISVSNANPLLSGTVEPFANMQIILMCPQNIPNCQNQTWQGNYPTGTWQHRFYNLIKGIVYTVYISATDAGGNSTVFPEFYLAYGITTPTSGAIITPITPPTGISPEPPEIITVPTPFVPIPPVSPTPPVFEFQSTSPKTIPSTQNILCLLLAIGLPLHLVLSLFGAKIGISNIIRFFTVLFFPFLKNKRFQTLPLSVINLYDPDRLNDPWCTVISDIKGYFNLKESLLNRYFVNITCTGRQWKNVIIQSEIILKSCFYTAKISSPNTLERLRMLSLTTRSIPLIVACITSAYCLINQPSYFFLAYLFISLLLVFSEYLYPRISR